MLCVFDLHIIRNTCPSRVIITIYISRYLLVRIISYIIIFLCYVENYHDYVAYEFFARVMCTYVYTILPLSARRVCHSSNDRLPIYYDTDVYKELHLIRYIFIRKMLIILCFFKYIIPI